ncbi:type I-E CRISPR-associated protein Cse2/CasB [Streptomyces sp. NBC_00568]|uniref:type I-E CRISPR-associated protein Cse2/CasB n=1 Tax=Streptomyces sp. NBC_00568 TaxID=2975779 RepID=UPI00225BE09F|nr:type I-E CRISPR-associated protein Cse2/CasB [Streptomyces sp. NBC_00568]MCX4993526.1 type I-E CRISPR-associated protein Cse2/CasB [Streptomyces sp. NBC_00568]
MTTAIGLGLPYRVRQTVSDHIAKWQHGYLADESHAVRAVARLRRGVPDGLGLINTSALHEGDADAAPQPDKEQIQHAEEAVVTALTMWAVHQQAQTSAMHRAGSAESPGDLGRALRQLMPPGTLNEAVVKRLIRAGTTQHLAELAQSLREIVQLLRQGHIPLDYAHLAAQLYSWQQPGGRNAVRHEWGLSFHSYYIKEPRSHNQTAATASRSLPEPESTVWDAS